MKKYLLVLTLSSLVFVTQAATIAAKTDTDPVNINTATAAQLATLKGVGPKRAEEIVDFRKQHGDFKSLDELTGVKGVSAKVLERWEKNNPDRMKLK